MSHPELRDLVMAGYSDTEIADRLGVSPRTVLRWRKRAGLPSMWAPQLVPCGTTTAGYRRGCRCQPCRDVHAAAQARTEAVYAALTRRAGRAYEPWSAEDDAIVQDTTLTVVQRAQRLERTYEACVQRLTVLRRRPTAA